MWGSFIANRDDWASPTLRKRKRVRVLVVTIEAGFV
jgi:hypothetical protein